MSQSHFNAQVKNKIIKNVMENIIDNMNFSFTFYGE